MSEENDKDLDLVEEGKKEEPKAEAPAPKQEDAEPEKKGGCLKFFFSLFAIFIVGGVICFLAFCYFTDRSIGKAKTALIEMYHTYRPQKVINSFYEFRDLQVRGNEGNVLEVATGEEVVELTREDAVRIFNKTVPGVKTTSRITVPATFRYHIDLKGSWDMVQDGHRLHVVAPSLKPSLPVAFDSGKLERVNPGWTKIISGSNMDELERSITPKLEGRAMDPELVKEFEQQAKISIARFLRTWLVGEDQWQKGKIEELVIYFEGDVIDTENHEKAPHMKLGEEEVLP